MSITDADTRFMRRAIELAIDGSTRDIGGPFGCVIVRDGKIIGEGRNSVTSTNDPTAHAEIVAIRDACRALGTFQLTDCIVYASCEPCPMCLGAIYWARPLKVFYAASRADAAAAGFDDQYIYDELAADNDRRKFRMTRLPVDTAVDAFIKWRDKPVKTAY